MKYVNSLWWPDSETHLCSYGIKYQGEIRHKAMEKVTNFSLAVDAGAHVGIASLHFSRYFGAVFGFEPIKETFECFKQNLLGVNNVMAINLALSNVSGQRLDFSFNEGNTGNTVPSESTQGTSPITAVRIDDFFISPGLIKIDVEGFEPLVIDGARETINRSHPVMLVESKGIGYSRKDPEAPLKMLEGMGYQIVENLSNDYVLTFGGK